MLAEEALARAANDLAVAKSALGGATVQGAGEACDAMELCCDRLLLVDLLLDPPPRVPVPGADAGFSDAAADDEVRLRAADALNKAIVS
jgi:hypothetical protein